MHSKRHRVLVAAPQGLEGSALVIATARAGGLGIADGSKPELRACTVSRLSAFRACSYALRVPPEQVSADWLSDTGGSLQTLVLNQGGVGRSFDEACILARRTGRQVLCEVISTAEAEAALAAGVDGLIAVGQEAAGRVGEESAFVLLQAILGRTDRPVWVRGGIGPRTAAACIAAGAAGVVLEGAVLLARESPLHESVRQRIAAWDGSETVLIEPPKGPSLRVHAPPTSPVLSRLRAAVDESDEAWTRALSQDVGWGPGQAWPVGQDAAWAADLASTHVTVGGILQETERSIDRGLASALQALPLNEHSTLARMQGTRFPILQGPMTRVSDVAPFAEAVSREGALPFIALALLRRPDVERLLAETARREDGRPWGVGLLGFAPPELRREQIAAVRAARPPFALIAGGRPDQAAELEQEGIATYLHVPSPGLLEQYLRSGARRFILEGRECGGHVGPRSSFVLWEQACHVVENAIERGMAADSLSLVFAGGIHDARSAAAVSALAGDLAARGVGVGILMGTAYLFTREAVETGAIVQRFQNEALRCRETVLLETGPGHQVRVCPTPFVNRFQEERRRLLASGKPHDEIRESLERLNAGRLRVAAKGIDRGAGGGSPMVSVPESDQAANGLYMLGQVAALRDRIVSVGELHREVTHGAAEWIGRQVKPEPEFSESAPSPAAIAIVGMAAVLPGAADVTSFWTNSLNGVDAITEVPPDRWDWRLYYDPDPKAPDKIYSKWGGFVPDVPFDPLRHGMPPASLPSIEPAQLLALEVARCALADAGYARRPFPRERTAVVLGMGGGAAQVAMGYAFRSYLPMLDTVLPDGGKAALEQCQGLLPEWTEDSFPGFLLNVTAGRIANRLDLGGANYTVDAACGSSLAALNLAVRELRNGAADMVLLGGVDTVQNPFTYLAFSKTQAFSRKGRCRPFDAGADGIVISEGVAVVVLKRLADAERDGDRIYAVIQGVGSSSDGRCRGLTAPSYEGQVRALERAYDQAGIDPSTVGYFEAHGTGTAVGDVVELEALTRLLKAADVPPARCVVGSVKSQIGHTKCAAGLAGLIHASLALHHRVYPPTIGISRPNPQLDLENGPCRLNTEPTPWLHHDPERPRRAGVSAFGFGGTNFHAVLEAYESDPVASPRASLGEWPAELFVWSATDPEALRRDLDHLAEQFDAGHRPRLCELSLLLNQRTFHASGAVLAIVATSVDDLAAKLGEVRKSLRDGRTDLNDPRGIYMAERASFAYSKVAFVFPGQGSQSVGMLRELAIRFDEVRRAFEDFDATFEALGREPVGTKVFPPPAFDDETRRRQAESLRATEVAQPAIGAASLGLLRLLRRLGLEPHMAAGHSYGELVALHASGALDAAGLARLSEARGRLLRDAGGDAPGAMAALLEGPRRVAELVEGLPDVRIVNFNGPRQTVVAGPREALEAVLERARSGEVRGRLLPVACAFHTPKMEPARGPLAELAARELRGRPALPVYSNLDAAAHPDNPELIGERLGAHVVSPVRFAETILAMHDQEARVFVEVGPGNVLTPLVDSILGDRPHLSVACDPSGRTGLIGFLHTLARLVVAGVSLNLEALTHGRARDRLDREHSSPGSGSSALSPSTWMINGSRARPLAAPEPRRLGQAPTSPASTRSNGRLHPQPTGSVTMQERSVPSSNGNGTCSNGHANGCSNGNGHSNGKHPAEAFTRPMPMPVPTASMPSASGASERVLAAFQETMRMFLDVQRSTMLTYLSSGHPSSVPTVPASPSSVPAHPPAMPERIAEVPERAATSPGYPPTRSDSPEFAPQSNGSIAAPPVSAPPRASIAPRTASTTATPEIPASAPGAHFTAASKDVPVTRDAIASKLLEIVRERTGYPLEVLGLELDLEADLGIDSIKRVEILGKLRDAFPTLADASSSGEMDRLASATTLAAIVDRAERAIGKLAGSHPAQEQGLKPARPSAANETANGKPQGLARRLILEPVEAPLGDHPGGLMPGGTVLITEDNRGVAERVAEKLKSAACNPVLLDPNEKSIDWTSQAAVEELIEETRGEGPIAGLVHLLPIGKAQGAELDPSAWASRVNPQLRGLFLLAKGLAADLEQAATRGGACLIAATSMGGCFASGGARSQQQRDFFPGDGGIAGLVKTLAREWPSVRSRVVDLDLDEGPARIAEQLVSEILKDDDWSEVGRVQGRRIRLRTVAAPLPVDQGTRGFGIAQGEPVLITGGARGITSLVAAELARRWKPTLLLIGTTPDPNSKHEHRLIELTDPAELKAALYEQMRREGRSASPRELEQAFQSVQRGREVQGTLERLRASGSQVEYAQADVRDAASIERVLAAWRRAHGEPVGFIHGAGLIRDKLLRDKSAESFDRVLSTKVDGALNLLRLLRPESLRFTILFSSIAGRFGNRGQSDYAAANEMLNKLAVWLDRRWPGRVLAPIWGPWSGIGMVSDLEQHLGAQGLGMIAPEVGVASLVHELARGRKGEVEVVLADNLGTLDGPLPRTSPRAEALR
jgi:acyl transferase domain-containing protein/NAD(P)H-dependent flavin oxidoreductase YrpB (nitropropane dioxygenase family)/NAD(P)-dependent dehydrogenase (short-subunit alcohol dehydrogenase family)